MKQQDKSRRKHGEPFAERVLAALLRIPRGRVVTYADIARVAGNPRAARAAGNALNKNPHAPRVPCHRVVRADGRIGGYAHGAAKKIALLTREGVIVRNGKVDLARFRIARSQKL